MAKALILGFGGSGAQTLTFEKEISVWKDGKASAHLNFLLFDTIKNWKAGGTVQILGGRGTEKLAASKDAAANLDEHKEYFHLSDHDPDLNRSVSDTTLPPHLANWLHTQWLALHVPEAARSIEEGAAQQRQIGRFAMFQNAAQVRRKLAEIFQQTRASDVWLISSAAGGTGAGALLDAALLARLAARDANIAPKVTGVVVLPDVYADKPGISKGRAYALFRELERLQENGFDAGEDAYRMGVDNVTVRIQYDNAGNIVATRGLGGLFDYLFFVGERCANDANREEFFSSLANAIDPYLDEVAGPRLLQASVNNAGKIPSSFGASRIYLPVQTLADIYSWEEVQSYIEEITAPVIERSRVIDVASGAAGDRRTDATSAFLRFLPFFGQLDNIFGTVDSAQWAGVGLNYTPTRVVEEHLQFANPQQAGFALSADDARLVKLTYRNPYVSLTEAEESVKPEAWRMRTHEQAKKAGIKETLEESRQRFQRELETITGTYRNAAGEGSFARGAEIVFQKVADRLTARIDDFVINGFTADSIGRNAAAPDQGTTLTRLYRVLDEMLADGGSVRNARAVLAAMRQAAEDRELKTGQNLQQIQADLKEWQPNSWWKGGGLTSGSNLAGQQEESATAAGEAAKAFQRRRLFDLVDRLLTITEERLATWQRQLRGMLDGLVLGSATSAAHGHARGALDELNNRLGRQASNRLAVIDPINAKNDRPGDPDLHGYRARLKRDTTTVPGTPRTLAMDRVRSSRWVPSIDDAQRPQLLLEVDGASYDAGLVSGFAAALAGDFRASIDRALLVKDIFDYLLFCQQEVSEGVSAGDISQILDARARALINLNVTEEKFLTYADPRAPVADIGNHRNFGEAVRGGVQGLSQWYDHSDRFSICLLKVKKPTDSRDIQDIRDCQQEYLNFQKGTLSNFQQKDDDLRRAEVYHIFRAELEAWYLEREVFLRGDALPLPENQIPPRIVRLLDEPARMSAFVKCLATGAIGRDENGWWWRDPKDQVVRLNDPSEGNPSVVRAAVNFVLRGQEGTNLGIRSISVQDALRSSATAASKKDMKESDLLREFAEQKRLEAFLDDAFPDAKSSLNYERERRGLAMILKFYATPGMSIDLVRRMLP